MPVERSTVSANVRAAAPSPSPSTSISSYSQTPSWATVRRPAVTKRLAGAVGSPNSSGLPSAVSPRSTTVKADSAREHVAGSGRGRWTRSRWSPLGLTKLVVTRTTDSSARSSTSVPMSTRCSPTRACDEPSTWSGHTIVAVMRARARTGPLSSTRTVDRHGRRPRPSPAGAASSCRSRPGRRRRPAGRTRPRRPPRRSPCGRRRPRRHDQPVATAPRRAVADAAPRPSPGAPAPPPRRPASRTRGPRRSGPGSAASTAGPWPRAPTCRGGRPGACTGPAWPPRWGRRASPRSRRPTVMSSPSSVSSMRTRAPTRRCRSAVPAACPASSAPCRRRAPSSPAAPSAPTAPAVGRGRTVGRHHELDHARARPGGRVDHRRAGRRQRPGERLQRPVGQPGADRPGLGVAVQHGVDHVVDGAGADGVVGGVAHHLLPGQVRAAGRVSPRRQEQGGTAARPAAPARARPPRRTA